MREVKKYDERKDEILKSAERLFYTKGYEKGTITDILKDVGIAKGTFYHYFSSKENALEAVVEKNIDVIVNRINKAINRDGISTLERLMSVFLAMRLENQSDELLNDLHKPDNALLHQKNLNQLIKVVTPILVGIIEEGINNGAWKCSYPEQYMQIFLSASLTLTDEGIFEVDKESQMLIMESLISLLEKMLEVEKNTFLRLYIQHWSM